MSLSRSFLHAVTLRDGLVQSNLNPPRDTICCQKYEDDIKIHAQCCGSPGLVESGFLGPHTDPKYSLPDPDPVLLKWSEPDLNMIPSKNGRNWIRPRSSMDRIRKVAHTMRWQALRAILIPRNVVIYLALTTPGSVFICPISGFNQSQQRENLGPARGHLCVHGLWNDKKKSGFDTICCSLTVTSEKVTFKLYTEVSHRSTPGLHCYKWSISSYFNR
jgi:hypothetical protein